MRKQKFKTVLRWVAWLLIIQFVLLNISAAFYARKFTHLYSPEEREAMLKDPPAKNIFAKTWRLFSGYRFYKEGQQGLPDFPYTVVHLYTGDSVLIEAWYGHIDSAKGTVILFHGLMGNKSFVIDQAREFRKRGYNVLMPDTRSHGSSGGSNTSYGYHESEEVKIAVDYVKGLGEKNISLWGISMGAVGVMKAVAEYKLAVSTLFLEMPFGSLQAHVKARLWNMGFPRQPFGFLITCWIGIGNGFYGPGFQTSKYASQIHCNVVVQYGAKDQLVSRKEIDEIYNAIPGENKELIIYPDAAHESLLHHDAERYKSLLDKYMGEVK
jgi:alpha-beta hydrolase superfamily lysophospholipase